MHSSKNTIFSLLTDILDFETLKLPLCANEQINWQLKHSLHFLGDMIMFVFSFIHNKTADLNY